MDRNENIIFQRKTIALIIFVGVSLVIIMGTTEAETSWTSGGPYGGNVLCLAMAPDPDDPDSKVVSNAFDIKFFMEGQKPKRSDPVRRLRRREQRCSHRLSP